MGVFVVTVLLVSLAFVTGYFANRDKKKIDTDTYQAVFLENGQVYFGRLSDINSDYVKLTDVYYLQSNQDVQGEKDTKSSEKEQNQMQLNRLGNELHGPQNQMFIVQENISFWENLKSDSNVVKAITNQNTSSSTPQVERGN